MKRSLLATALAVALGVTASSALAQAKPEVLVKQRQAAMTLIGKYFGPLGGMAQGKVPYKVIVNRYGKQVRQEVVGEVVQSSFYQALQQEKLIPAGRPSIAPLDAEQGRGLSYTARFEVMPEVKLVDAGKIKVEKPVFEIGDEDYLKMVEMLRRQRQTLQAAERESREGDTLEIDFEGRLDGEPFEGGSAKDFRLELGQSRFIEGFEAGLKGKKAGETVTLDLKFPDDYQAENLAGKPVKFEVTVKQVLEPVLPHTTVAGVPARLVGRPKAEEPALDMDHHLNDDVVGDPSPGADV